MKKMLCFVVAVVSLSGCTVVPVTGSFPTPPPSLLKECPDLKTVPPDTTKLSDVLLTVTDNYAEYHECKIRVDSWILWWKKQQEIYNSIK
jgi:hypothetical protein